MILGVVPIEDMARRRPLAALAEASDLTEAVPIASLVDAVALRALERRFGAKVGRLPLAAALRSRRADLGQAEVSLAHLRAPVRTRVARRMRSDLAVDLARVNRLMARGRTVYLTPEGRISDDGRLGRFRLALEGLRIRANAVTVASLAYDNLQPGRLRLYVRLVPVAPGRGLRDALLAERMVAPSQVVARFPAPAPRRGDRRRGGGRRRRRCRGTAQGCAPGGGPRARACAGREGGARGHAPARPDHRRRLGRGSYRRRGARPSLSGGPPTCFSTRRTCFWRRRRP